MSGFFLGLGLVLGFLLGLVRVRVRVSIRVHVRARIRVSTNCSDQRAIAKELLASPRYTCKCLNMTVSRAQLGPEEFE